jgi:hypothetical protein
VLHQALEQVRVPGNHHFKHQPAFDPSITHGWWLLHKEDAQHSKQL